jgi:hypothetical protein
MMSLREPARTILLVASLTLAITDIGLPRTADAGPPDLRITTGTGAQLTLEPEELQGPAMRPLRSTRDRLHQQFRKEFLWFFKARIVDGTTVVGRLTVDRGPLRVTMYEITKNEGAPRWLRVVGTRVYRAGQLAEFQTILTKSLEHVYLITAEAVSAVDQLNPHLRYMNTQGDQILVQGYSTNWNLSVLKFRLLEKSEGGAREGEFARDADWLVSNLLDPYWIVSIRIE